MNSTLKNVYLDKLYDIVNKYNNTYHRAIKMKPADVKPSIYSDFIKENNKKGPKFKVDDHVRILKYKSNFAKGYVANWSDFMIKLKLRFYKKKVKSTVSWTYAISDLNGEEIVGRFYEKEL